MPSTTSHRRSRSVYEDEDGTQSPAPESSKRQRQGRRRQSLENNSEEDDSDHNESNESHTQTNGSSSFRANGAPNPNGQHDAEGHHPGAIVRVMVEDFVTYEHAEFFPGPNLNMVIGPNGTGKSSLVCAICLGLGFHPRNLGRAGHVGEFVKHGKDYAVIEVELQANPNQRSNPVVRVQISREDNGRKWWLNGKESTQKAVHGLTKEMRIQIDNLCQFLPQDKVAEFAGLTPIDLLHETLRAAAPETMIEEQSQLKTLHQEHKKLKANVDASSETLKQLESRQQAQQADVDRFKERDAITERIKEWKKTRICAEYVVAKNAYSTAKAAKNEAVKRLDNLERACGPALEAVNSKQDYKTKIELVVSDREKRLKDAEARSAQSIVEIEKQGNDIVQKKREITAEQSSFTKRRDEIRELRLKITGLQAKHKQEPPAFVAGEWNQKIRQREHRQREIAEEKRQANTHKADIQRKGQAVRDEIKQLRKEIDDLNSQEGQLVSYLRRIDPHVAKGWEWLQDHRDEFDEEVFGPPMLNCSLKDGRYSDLVQSMLAKNDFLCFITQTRKDHQKLSDQFYKEMKLRVTIKTCVNKIEEFRPPMSADEARQLGIDGFAIDYIDGPSPVLATLCSDKRLHASGVALREASAEQFKQLFEGQKISQWATGSTRFQVIRRREYGPGAETTSTRQVRPGQFWTDQPVDNAEKADLQNKLEAKEEEKQELIKDFGEAKDRLAELENKDKEIAEEILRSDKSKLQTAYTHWSALPEKINTENASLKERQESFAECRSRIAQLTAQVDNLCCEKAQAVIRHKALVEKIRSAHLALLDARIRLVEATSDIQGLKDRNRNITQDLENTKAEIENHKAAAVAAKAEAVRIGDSFEDFASDEHDISHYREKAAGKTPEDIDQEIEAEEANYTLIQPVDQQVLRQYEKRNREIQDYTNRKEDQARKLEKVGDQIQKLMRRWEPSVDQLVSRINDAFSYNFQQISCAGEVGVHKEEDFDQWAIEIKVKFRENETLQQLNQHRQSGGERAVSTIFYLMALQSMAQAPFRVVDEINQGMDPRNERMVHERMVEIACREHTSQYFLITPKLLTGLRYDPRMRVLCIASGEHVPPEARQLDFKKLVGLQRAATALKASA
ncbi:P-loop containing nucleoside triphosphate hydrolase protein [Apiospora rasikravindrae]|uniref:Structural maintenance of chromosomes protein 5 n=1 Tax=Apiospora rasikravindrae TaxID=990691 RepID=A0ABR1T6B8_9PEZI